MPVTAKIRDQDFDLAARDASANFGDCAGKNSRASVGLIVAVDGSHHRIAQAHELRRFRHPLRLQVVRGPSRLARRHGAKAASARADISQNHERRRAMFPAFAMFGSERSRTRC